MHFRLAASFVIVVACLANSAHAESPSEWVSTQASSLVELYQWFHKHPELSNYEEQTAVKLAGLWKEAGFDVTTGVGGHGIVGVLKNGPGPTLMLRTDMDALPVTGKHRAAVRFDRSKFEERRRQPYRRDARLRSRYPHDQPDRRGAVPGQPQGSDWSGTLVFIGQPAEERGAGAKRCSDDGLFTKFPSPTWRWRCTSTRRWKPARSAIGPATRWPTSTASTSR